MAAMQLLELLEAEAEEEEESPKHTKSQNFYLIKTADIRAYAMLN